MASSETTGSSKTAGSSENAPARGVAAALRKRHRVIVPVLLTIAVIVGFFACFAVWINRQVLNTNNFTNTTSELLGNEKVQAALSTYVVSTLFTSVNVEEELKSALPTQVQALAGPAASGLRVAAEEAVPKLLATSQVQEGWRRASRAAHAQLINILNGGGKTISTKSGVVSLNVHELVSEVAKELGLQSQLAAARAKLQGGGGAKARAVAQEKLGVTLPASSGEIVILRSSQLKAAQDIVKALRGLAIALPLIALALFALAIWLSEGRRRRTLRTSGWCFFGIGILLLLARRVGGDAVVNSLVKVPANKPAAHEVWSIGTSLLYDIATAMVLYGLVIVVAAWLAGTTRPALAVRRALAPWMREHEVGSYVGGEALLLLVVLWGPTAATREIFPVIGFAALVAFAVWLLRRDTMREFPDSQIGDAGAAMKRWMSNVRGHRAGEPAVAHAGGGGGGTHASADVPNGARVQALERLAALHERGALTDEEFAAEKAALP